MVEQMSASCDLQAEASPISTWSSGVGLTHAILEDGNLARKKLDADASRLFSSSTDRFDVILVLEGSQGPGLFFVLVYIGTATKLLPEIRTHHVNGTAGGLPDHLVVSLACP
jgi:hypothetical protein